MTKGAIYLIEYKNGATMVAFYIETYNKMMWFSPYDNNGTSIGVIKSDTKSIKKIYEA